MATTGITLYTAATPNGWKISIALEELGLKYVVKVLEMSKQEQKAPDFVKINPNGRLPAIVDHDNGDLAVWESGAILMYLGDKYGKGKLMPEDDKGRYSVISWLMWQMAGQGPMQGQCNFFTHYFTSKEPRTVVRFLAEAKRLYGVLDEQLSKNKFVAGDTYTIADVAVCGWAVFMPMAGIDVNDYPNVAKWLTTVAARPAVIAGCKNPAASGLLEQVTEAWKDPAKLKVCLAEVHAKQALSE